MATATKAKGFDVRCPHCHDEDATISLDLADVQTVRCSACDEEFTVREAILMVTTELQKWQAVGRWVEMAAGLRTGSDDVSAES